MRQRLAVIATTGPEEKLPPSSFSPSSKIASQQPTSDQPISTGTTATCSAFSIPAWSMEIEGADANASASGATKPLTLKAA